MRVLVTGSSGFVGGWLLSDLAAEGHVPLAWPSGVDVADVVATRVTIAEAQPDAVVHLAGVAFAPDAAADSDRAIRVNVGGTLSLLEGCRSEAPAAAILVAGSGEVYAPAGDRRLTEDSSLGPRSIYGLTKLGAEAIALEMATLTGLRVVVTRSFNHTGPGQRPVFAIPAFAQRILEARRAGSRSIRAGNVHVARDISDVRDVVRAYRLLIEALADDRIAEGYRVVNVASGVATPIGDAIELLGELARWPVDVHVDPALVRADDPPVIVASPARLQELTGWTRAWTLRQTLGDLLSSLASTPDTSKPATGR
jgi:GDP-4-dehydro-6-deoxy-D-mannose reductase